MSARMTDPGTEQAWKAIESEPRPSLASLFESEPDRLDRLVIQDAGIRFDF